MKEMKYSVIGGLGILLAIGGVGAAVIGAFANRPPPFLLPLGTVGAVTQRAILLVLGLGDGRVPWLFASRLRTGIR